MLGFFFLKCCGFWTLHICRMVDPPASPVEVAKLFWHNSITAVARSGQKNRCFHATCQQWLFLLRKTRHLKGLKGRFIGFLRGLNAHNMLRKITYSFKDTNSPTKYNKIEIVIIAGCCHNRRLRSLRRRAVLWLSKVFLPFDTFQHALYVTVNALSQPHSYPYYKHLNKIHVLSIQNL